MSGSVNKVILIGNLGDDVKIHHFDNNNCLARFPIATNEFYTSRESGERVTQTEWHNIVIKNKLAELCEKYLSKGDSIYVEGKIRTRKWNDNGTTRYSTEIHASTIQFLDTKNRYEAYPQNAEEDNSELNQNKNTESITDLPRLSEND